MNDKVDLLTSLLKEAENLSYIGGTLDKVRKRAEMLIKKTFGKDSEYIVKLNNIRFSPSVSWSGMGQSQYTSAFNSGKKQLMNLIDVMLEDLSLSNIDKEDIITDSSNNILSDNIFVVHGHNEEMKQASARFLEKIGLNPIILHEQPNKGQTIIEKFTDYSDVSFAIVLLSADDVAFNKTETVENAKLRARQNVIFELGFFLGKIGRQNVVVVYEQVDNLEIPSDYQGVLYIPYDNNGIWKLSIAKELKAVGFNIDGNKLLE